MQNLHILHNNIASSSTRFMCFVAISCSLSTSHSFSTFICMYFHLLSSLSFVLSVQMEWVAQLIHIYTWRTKKIFTLWSSLVWMSYFVDGISYINTFCNKQFFVGRIHFSVYSFLLPILPVVSFILLFVRLYSAFFPWILDFPYALFAKFTLVFFHFVCFVSHSQSFLIIQYILCISRVNFKLNVMYVLALFHT